MRRAARALLYLGVAGVVLGLGKLHASQVGSYDLTSSSRFAWSVVYIGLLGGTAYAVGLPDVPRTRRAAAAWSLSAAGAGAGAISLAQLAMGEPLLPRLVVLGSAAILVPWYIVCATVARDGAERDGARDRLVLVGSPGVAAQLADELAQSPERPASLSSVLAVDQARSEAAGSQPLVAEVAQSQATVVVLDRTAQTDENIVAQSAILHEAGVRIRTLSLLYEDWLGKLPVSELERVSLMFDIGEVHRARYGRVKRLLDLVLASIGVGGLIVVTPLIIAGDLFANRGPLLYRQERVGKGGRHFTIVKFRTMRPAAGVESTWTAMEDPRVTSFGGLLRRSHLDELPQVLNILRGDLSVVGPRPEQPSYVAELASKLPFYGLRHLVRPGLTGWAQVKYGYASDERDALEKLQYEFFYLRHQGLRLDARIIGRTVRSVLGREGSGR